MKTPKKTGSMPAAAMRGKTTGTVPTSIGKVSKAMPSTTYMIASTHSSIVGEISNDFTSPASDCGTPSKASTKPRYNADTRMNAVMAVRRMVARKQSCSSDIESFPYSAAIGKATITPSAALSVTVAQPV